MSPKMLTSKTALCIACSVVCFTVGSIIYCAFLSSVCGESVVPDSYCSIGSNVRRGFWSK